MASLARRSVGPWHSTSLRPPGRRPGRRAQAPHARRPPAQALVEAQTRSRTASRCTSAPMQRYGNFGATRRPDGTPPWVSREAQPTDCIGSLRFIAPMYFKPPPAALRPSSPTRCAVVYRAPHQPTDAQRPDAHARARAHAVDGAVRDAAASARHRPLRPRGAAAWKYGVERAVAGASASCTAVATRPSKAIAVKVNKTPPDTPPSARLPSPTASRWRAKTIAPTSSAAIVKGDRLRRLRHAHGGAGAVDGARLWVRETSRRSQATPGHRRVKHRAVPRPLRPVILALATRTSSAAPRTAT